MALPLFNDFEKLVLNRTPLIDVRAPIEFEKGAFLTAVNLPLMSNKERELVGIRYKNNGNAAALELGHQLVLGDFREARIQAWCDFIDANPEAMLYCFRGGQRSQIAQQWLHDRGYPIVRLKGGYKAFRAFLLEQLESMQGRFAPILLGGYTGSGKTLLLHELENIIDLEGLAKHRGSSFGATIEPQPTQINFENNLAFDLLQKLQTGFKSLIFEDEGRHIGRVHLPQKFYEVLVQGELVVLETPLKERIEITFNEYVKEAQTHYIAAYKEDGYSVWKNGIQASFDRIRKRIGFERYSEITTLYKAACQEQEERANLERHKEWIEKLLVAYYDPMYDYQLKKRVDSISFRGNKEAVREYLIYKREMNSV